MLHLDNAVKMQHLVLFKLSNQIIHLYIYIYIWQIDFNRTSNVSPVKASSVTDKLFTRQNI